MKKAEIVEGISNIFHELKDKVQDNKGMTAEEVKKLYDEVYYLFQQATSK